jgi:hypothetical protein
VIAALERDVALDYNGVVEQMTANTSVEGTRFHSSSLVPTAARARPSPLRWASQNAPQRFANIMGPTSH